MKQQLALRFYVFREMHAQGCTSHSATVTPLISQISQRKSSSVLTHTYFHDNGTQEVERKQEHQVSAHR